MRRKIILIISFLFLFLLGGCTIQEKDNDGKIAKFIVNPGFEKHEDVPNLYRLDMVLPEVAESVPNGEKINEEIDKSFAWRNEETTEDNYAGETGYAYPWVKIRYEVCNINGICALNIFHELTSALGSDSPRITLYSYYYNENTGAILSKDGYIEKLGYTQEDIIQNFKKRYNGKYDNVPFKFQDVLFYFDQNSNLQFLTTIVDTYSQ